MFIYEVQVISVGARQQITGEPDKFLTGPHVDNERLDLGMNVCRFVMVCSQAATVAGADLWAG